MGAKAFPGMDFPPGGYAAVNDTLPVYDVDNNDTFEYYLQDEYVKMDVTIA